MNSIFSYILGILLFLYGVCKIIIVILAFSLSEEVKAKIENIPVLNILINNDNTIAGRFFDVVLIFFAFYTLLHSLKVLRILRRDSLLYTIASSEEVHYGVNLTIGLLLFLFYLLVSYTSLPIPKNDEDTFSYKVGGVAGGLSFLLSVPIMYLYFSYKSQRVCRDIRKVFKYHRFRATLAVFAATVFFAGIIAVICEAYLHNSPVAKSHAFSNFIIVHLSYLK